MCMSRWMRIDGFRDRAIFDTSGSLDITTIQVGLGMVYNQDNDVSCRVPISTFFLTLLERSLSTLYRQTDGPTYVMLIE